MWVCRQCVLSAGTRLCDESVICKVASLKALNSKQVLLWIFDLKRTDQSENKNWTESVTNA